MDLSSCGVLVEPITAVAYHGLDLLHEFCIAFDVAMGEDSDISRRFPRSWPAKLSKVADPSCAEHWCMLNAGRCIDSDGVDDSGTQERIAELRIEQQTNCKITPNTTIGASHVSSRASRPVEPVTEMAIRIAPEEAHDGGPVFALSDDASCAFIRQFEAASRIVFNRWSPTPLPTERSAWPRGSPSTLRSSR
jgi:hypothetical protein